MKIAVDKNSLSAIEPTNEYIYLFDDEPLEELLKLNMHCINWENCDYVDINLTEYDVPCFKQTTIFEKNYNKMEKSNYRIGIIVPNYNYEHTIQKCLESILNQSYKNFEIIFIDDMSTDGSVKTAQETYKKYLNNNYKEQDSTNILETMKIVQLRQKRYNGGARNEAYLHLSDNVDYIYYVDSDDWLYNEDVLNEINDKLQTNPDVLFVGMASYKNKETKMCFIPNYKDKYQAIEGWSGSCGKIIKKELATRQECLYNEGTLKEDKNQHCKICIYMKDFKLLKKPIYVWNQENTKSVTTIREKIYWGTSTIRHYADTLQLYLREKGKDPKIDKILYERVQKTKREMLDNGDKQW